MELHGVRTWAPGAERVEVVLEDGRRLAARPEGPFWWRCGEPVLAAGTRYRIAVDGRDPLPDPRSLRQPDGPHGASAVVVPGSFAWSDEGFRAPPLSSAVIYELHVGTFTSPGTFEGVIARLDDLVALGVTHIELMPVAAFPGRWGWGYDGASLFAPHEPYGGPEGLVRLVDAAHRAGLGVILDVVYNHLGPDGSYIPSFGPFFTDHYRTPWGDAVNLDGEGSDAVRALICDNALHWLETYHLDGLRLDAVHALHDRSAVHLLEELAGEVARLEAATGRPRVLIAESDLNDPRVIRPVEAGGLGMHAQWSDDLHHAIHALLTGERDGYYADFGELEHLRRALTEGFVYAGHRSGFRRRRHGRPLQGISGHRLIGYAQTHDQVGNRARGRRLSHLVTPGRARMAAALAIFAPHVPMLFMGEEWAASTPFPYFTDHTDPQLAEAVREGRKAEFAAFGWDPADIPDPQGEWTYRSAVLRWEERSEPEHARMLAWYRSLIALRRSVPELSDGRWDRVRVAYEEAAWLRVRRGPVTLVCNLGGSEVTVPVEGEAEPLLGEGVVRKGAVTLAPDEVAVLRGP